MAKTSSIEKLPPDILEQLQQLLRDPRCSQLQATAQINEVLEQQGHDDRISKSAVNRYDLKMREVGDRLKQSRQMAEMWIAKIGAAPQGQIGHLVNEILRTLSFELSMKITEGEITDKNMSNIIGMLQKLSLATMRLERASTENIKREAEIRKQAANDAAAAAEEKLASQGMSAEAIQSIKNDILGIA